MNTTVAYDKCRNSLCSRKVKVSVAYCCAACAIADERKYEIHESGVLGHSSECNKRSSERGVFTPPDPQYHL